MPTIVFASPKGGAGKSTSAVVLATELAQKGAAVTVIDADPNHPVSQWAKRPGTDRHRIHPRPGNAGHGRTEAGSRERIGSPGAGEHSIGRPESAS